MPFANILYREFREYLVETDESGAWEDKRFHDTFDSFVEEHNIKIEYKYADTVGSNTILLKWRCINNKDEPGTKFRSVRYTGSSRFAMWWCAIIGDDEDEDLCEVCHEKEDECECDHCPSCNDETGGKNWCNSRSCCRCEEITFCRDCVSKQEEQSYCSHDWEGHYICGKCEDH